MSTPSRRDRFLGCLLGGAAGDALGAPVEFMQREDILRRFGPPGITDFVPAYGRLGAITDDTQMTLFTAEGLLRGWTRGAAGDGARRVVAHAYLRWLKTQGVEPTLRAVGEDGWLFAQRDLHAPRAPGRTCVQALTLMEDFSELAQNGSKGCGGVMRMAPAGLFGVGAGHSAADTFALGCELSAVTHGHATGQLTGGVLAVVIAELCRGASLDAALDTATGILVGHPAHVETAEALRMARALAATDEPRADAIERLGQGWIAEEALAIAVYAALVTEDFADGVILAVNHSGDSDSTGAITGNILGTMHGVGAIPSRWLDGLELRDVITRLAIDMDEFPTWSQDLARPDAALHQRYPGW